MKPMRLLAIWCLITGGVKLVLVLRGFPARRGTEDPGMPHGNAPFTKPDQAAKGLSK